jgi:hypothetical protein
MTDTTTAAEKAAPAPRTLLQRRQQKTITVLLTRRLAAIKFINKAEHAHAQKIAPYESELASVAQALQAEGCTYDPAYLDEMCESGCIEPPVGSFGDDGIYLCQACVDSAKQNQAASQVDEHALAAAEGEGMTAPVAKDDHDEPGKLQHAYTRGA